MSKVTEIYNKLDQNLSSNVTLVNDLNTEMSRLVSQAYSQAMASDEGFCFKFTLPITAVTNLFQLVKLDQDEVGKAFQEDWKYPSHANMYADPYYHILMLLLYYGLRKKKEIMVEHALFLILIKTWNGRKAKYLKFCDKRVMNYVVTHMVNNKHLISKYESPLNLIKEYFIPTLLSKYSSEILKDPYRMRQLFMQIWVRVDQIFGFNMRVNPITGVNEAQGGILPLYMKAKKDNLTLATPTIATGDEEEPDFDQYSTIHNRDEITSSTTDFITMNTQTQYPASFISTVNGYTKVSSHVIEEMLKAMHSHKFYDILHNIISIILSRTSVVDKSDICGNDFMVNVKKNVISSKNTDDIRNIQKLLDALCIQIFDGPSLKLDFNKYSNVQRIQIRNVLIYGLIYNLKKINCQGQSI